MKQKGNRTWRDIIDDALFGPSGPDFISYEEMTAYVDQKIAEALARKAD